MHDGRFATIQGVLNHYNTGVRDTEVTDNLLFRQDGRVDIPMSGDEKAAIISFLHTLTDQAFLGNKDFSNPKDTKK